MGLVVNLALIGQHLGKKRHQGRVTSDRKKEAQGGWAYGCITLARASNRPVADTGKASGCAVAQPQLVEDGIEGSFPPARKGAPVLAAVKGWVLAVLGAEGAPARGSGPGCAALDLRCGREPGGARSVRGNRPILSLKVTFSGSIRAGRGVLRGSVLLAPGKSSREPARGDGWQLDDDCGRTAAHFP